MDVALDGGDDQASLFHRGAALLGNGGPDDLKHRLGRLGGAEKLGQKYLALFIALAHLVQGGDQVALHQGELVLRLQGGLGQLAGIGPQAPDDGLVQCHFRRGRGGRRLGVHAGEAVHVGPALPVLAGEHPKSRHGVHHLPLVGVDDGQAQSGPQGLDEEILGDERPVGQAEGDVGHAQHRPQAQFLMDGPHRPQGLYCLVLLGGDRQRQAVDPHILFGDAVGQGRLQDAAGNGHPALRRLGNAVFVQSQAHHGGAVFFHDGQQPLQHRRVAVDGVHRRLAVVHPQARFQSRRVGGVQLQGDVQGALQLFHHPGQHGHLVHAGIAHVHVQDIRSGVHLLEAHIQDIIQVLLQQGLLEPLFAGGVDALADDPHAVQPQRLRGGANKRHGVIVPLGRRFALQRRRHGPDIGRGRAAAAAEQRDAQVQAGGQGRREGLRSHVVVAVHRVRQARVGLGDHRQAGVFAYLFQHGSQHIRPQGAVEADGVRPQALQRPGHGGHGAAGEGAAPGLKGHGDEGRQVRVLLHRQQRRLGLVQVRHGLDDRQVRSGPGTGLRHLPEQVVGPLKGQAAHGLQQLSQGADVQRHQGPAPHGLFCQLHRRRDDLVHRVAGPLQLQAVGAEGIRIHHLAAGIHIFLVHGAQQRRLRQIQQLRLAAGGQSPLLEHGAHGAVQYHDLVLDPLKSHSAFLLCAGGSWPPWRSMRSPGSGPSGAGPRCR